MSRIACTHVLCRRLYEVHEHEDAEIGRRSRCGGGLAAVVAALEDIFLFEGGVAASSW